MKVKVNRDACIGCGACEAIAPNVFELDDEGVSTVKVSPVAKEDEGDSKEAVESCPTSAILEEKE